VLVEILGLRRLEVMTLCERVFWMDGVGIGFVGIVGCVLFGFEVFESG
jgi:hypothetical protein